MPGTVRRTLSSGRKLEAVLMLRELRDIDFTAAKEAVDRHLSKHPGLARLCEPLYRNPTHWLGWTVLAMAVAALLAYLRLGTDF